jgi:curved DNA-binding protein CbpA
MSFQIERGLFKFDFIDQHAILGVPVDANPDQIRQRYKQIARRLHPDSTQATSPAEKELAVQLFSKLVSSAYTQLSKERPRAEYVVMLGHMGKRVAQEAGKVQIQSEVAQQLAQIGGGNLEYAYKTSLQKLAAKQYDSLDKVVEAIAQISELNMVYLMRQEQEGQGFKMPTTTVATATTSNNTRNSSQDEETLIQQASPVEPYLRRATDYMVKNNFAKATLELRDALHLDPSNSKCHSLLGMIYLKQNQATMAKVHINKALQLNPQDSLAIRGKQELDKLTQRGAGSKTTTPPQSTGGKPSDQSGGLFGGLFGGKKK